jgi:uncharacterized membrane protein YkvA (DUF1232 family)
MSVFPGGCFPANRDLRGSGFFVRCRQRPFLTRFAPGPHRQRASFADLPVASRQVGVQGLAMRNDAARPTLTTLPLSYVAPPGRHPHNVADLDFNEAAIARFNDVLHSVYPEAPRVDANLFAGLVQWLLDLPPRQSRRELRQRLARVADLEKMAADRDWDTDEAQRAGLARLLEYLDDPDDLIPDRTPRLGRLDDALLIELAWPAFADEVEDYLDFCRFRHERHPRGSPPLKRSAWIGARSADVAPWRQVLHVHHARQGEHTPIAEGSRAV